MGSNPAAPTNFFVCVLLTGLALWTAHPVHAAVRCAATPRPGIFWPRGAGWSGVLASLCQRLGAQTHQRPELLAWPASGVDLALLTQAERPDSGQAWRTGPAVARIDSAVLVPTGAAARHLGDLAHVPICVEPGTASERGLLAAFAHHRRDLDLSPFQEPGEMLDAFAVGRCPAIAGERGSLALLAGRVLPERFGGQTVRIHLPVRGRLGLADVTRALARRPGAG